MSLVPWLSSTRRFAGEFALLAATRTSAPSIDLPLQSVFWVSPFAALSLSLFAAIAVQPVLRQWIFNRLLCSGVLTNERMFGHLYRIARDVQAHPERTAALLAHCSTTCSNRFRST